MCARGVQFLQPIKQSLKINNLQLCHKIFSQQNRPQDTHKAEYLGVEVGKNKTTYRKASMSHFLFMPPRVDNSKCHFEAF